MAGRLSGALHDFRTCSRRRQSGLLTLGDRLESGFRAGSNAPAARESSTLFSNYHRVTGLIRFRTQGGKVCWLDLKPPNRAALCRFRFASRIRH